MDGKLKIAVLLGTIRSGRASEAPAHWLVDFLQAIEGVDVALVDPRQLNLPDEGEEAKDAGYSQLTAEADAFVIVTPEYNHSFPGSLKRVLDSEYNNYNHKPVALVGVSSGGWGGVRVCEALLPVCHRLGLVNIRPELYFPRVQDVFSSDGTMLPEFTEQYTKNTQGLYDELIWLARLLKQGRTEQS